MLSGLWNIGNERHGRPRSLMARRTLTAGKERREGNDWHRGGSRPGARSGLEGVAQHQPPGRGPGGPGPGSRPGVIDHFWVTTTGSWRDMVLRMYWDWADEPAVEVPLGDFFCNGWDSYSAVNSVPVVVAPYRGFNAYWEMPFGTGARISLENVGREQLVVYYQVDYIEREVGAGLGYFHARWRRENPPSKRASTRSSTARAVPACIAARTWRWG